MVEGGHAQGYSKHLSVGACQSASCCPAMKLWDFSLLLVSLVVYTSQATKIELNTIQNDQNTTAQNEANKITQNELSMMTKSELIKKIQHLSSVYCRSYSDETTEANTETTTDGKTHGKNTGNEDSHFETSKNVFSEIELQNSDYHDYHDYHEIIKIIKPEDDDPIEVEDDRIELVITEDPELGTTEVSVTEEPEVETTEVSETDETEDYEEEEYWERPEIRTYTKEERERCERLTGKFIIGKKYGIRKFVGLEVQHDLQKILKEHGGLPGDLRVKWRKSTDAPIGNASDQRPLPEADEKYWVYKYSLTDGITYTRFEHAVCRFTGTPKAFLEIRGQIYWTPKDYCQRKRKGEYFVDDRGFTYSVGREFCKISRRTYGCGLPPLCRYNDSGDLYCWTQRKKY